MTSYCNCTTCQIKHKKCLNLISSYLVGTSTSTLCKGVPKSCQPLTSFSHNNDDDENDKKNYSSAIDILVDNADQQTKTKKKNKKIHTRRSYLVVRTDGRELVENRPIAIPVFKDNDNNQRTIVYDPSNVDSGVVLSHAARHVFDELLAEHIFSIILESATGMEATINIQERLSSYTLWYCANQAVFSLFDSLVSSTNIYAYSNKLATEGLRMFVKQQLPSAPSLSDVSSVTFPSSITDHELTNYMVPVYPYDSYGIQPNICRTKTSKILYSRINISLKQIEQYVKHISYFVSFDDDNESLTTTIQNDMQYGMIPCWSGVFFCPRKYNKRRRLRNNNNNGSNTNISNFMKRLLLFKCVLSSSVNEAQAEKQNEKKDKKKKKSDFVFKKWYHMRKKKERLV